VDGVSLLIVRTGEHEQADARQIPDWMAAFVAAGNKDVTAQVLPGLNHLFVVDPDGFPGNYAKLPPPVRVDPNVVGFVTDWLVRRLK